MTVPINNGNNNSPASFFNDVGINNGGDYLTPAGFASDSVTPAHTPLLAAGSSAFEAAIPNIPTPGLEGENPSLAFDVSSAWPAVTDGKTHTPFSLKEEPIIVEDLPANSPFSHGDLASGNPALEISNHDGLSTGLLGLLGSTALTTAAPATSAAPSASAIGAGWAASSWLLPMTAAVGALFPSEAGAGSTLDEHGRDMSFIGPDSHLLKPSEPASWEGAFASLPATGDGRAPENGMNMIQPGENVSTLPPSPKPPKLETTFDSPRHEDIENKEDDDRESNVFKGGFTDLGNIFGPFKSPVNSGPTDDLYTTAAGSSAEVKLNAEPMMSEGTSDPGQNLMVGSVSAGNNRFELVKNIPVNEFVFDSDNLKVLPRNKGNGHGQVFIRPIDRNISGFLPVAAEFTTTSRGQVARFLARFSESPPFTAVVPVMSMTVRNSMIINDQFTKLTPSGSLSLTEYTYGRAQQRGREYNAGVQVPQLFTGSLAGEDLTLFQEAYVKLREGDVASSRHILVQEALKNTSLVRTITNATEDPLPFHEGVVRKLGPVTSIHGETFLDVPQIIDVYFYQKSLESIFGERSVNAWRNGQ